MSHRREPEEQAVRVVQPAGDAPLAPRPGRFTLLAAAAVGAAVGFLIGGIATGVGSGERTVTTDTGAVVGLAEPDEGPATPTTADTTTTAAPVTTTMAEERPAIAFSDLVPDLDGTLLVALPAGDETWAWASGRVEPQRTPLPLATAHASWNAGATAMAALAGPLAGRTLYLNVGDGAGFVPTFRGARDFAWHASDPGRIAWVADDAGGSVLHVGEITDRDVVSTLAVPITGDAPPPRIAAWGDWGFVLTRMGGPADGDRQVVTLDTSGVVLAEARAAVLAVRDDGLLLVADAGDVAITEPDLVPVGPGPEGIAAPGAWSPAGLLLGSVVATPPGPALQVDGRDGLSFRSVLGVDEATMVGWAGGERFAVMWSPDAEELVPGGSRVEVPALIVVDVLDRSTHAIPVPSLPSDFVWIGG